MRRSRPPGGPWAVLTAALLALACLPMATAHGDQVGSTPAPNSRLEVGPTEIHIIFSEPVEVSQTQVRVYDVEGIDHGRGPLRAPGNASRASEVFQGVEITQEGTYTVAWQALWVSDGHTTQGGFSFAVGDAPLGPVDLPATSATPPPLEAAFRALGFIGWLGAVGLLAYPLLVSEPAWKGHLQSPEVRALVRRRTGAAAAALAALALVAAVGGLLEFSARGTWGLAGVAQAATQTRVGSVLAVRGALALLLVGVAAWAWRSGRGHAASLAVALAGLLTLTLASHAMATRDAVAIVADVMHLVAAALWLGVLAGLLLTMRRSLRLQQFGTRGHLVVRLVTNVSWVALSSVFALAVTGTIAAVTHVGAVSALWTTTYGRILLFKLGLFGLLLLMGLVNRSVFLPRLRRSRTDDDPTTRRRFARMVGAEVVAIMVVLATTGVLAGTNPAPPGPAVGLTLTGEGSFWLKGQLRLDPARVGVNAATLDISLPNGDPVPDATNVTILTNHLEGRMPRGESALEETTPGRWEGNVTFGTYGDWFVTVRVERAQDLPDALEWRIEVPR